MTRFAGTVGTTPGFSFWRGQPTESFMAGNWRKDERYGPDGRPRGRWSDDRPTTESDDYAFGQNESREHRDYGPFGSQREYQEPGYGRAYAGERGDYPDFDRSAPYGGNPWRKPRRDNSGGGDAWRSRSVDTGRERPTNWGPDWGDVHGRAGARGDTDEFGYGRGGRGSPYRRDRDFWDRASDEVASWFGDDAAERRRRMDAQEDHRGRGPKGYTRSDDRIRDDVSDALSDDNLVDAREISVSVSNAEVTLDGTVDTRFAKRRAEDCAERVSGVTHVQNNLRVKRVSMEGSTGGGETTDQSGASRIASRYPV